MPRAPSEYDSHCRYCGQLIVTGQYPHHYYRPLKEHSAEGITATDILRGVEAFKAAWLVPGGGPEAVVEAVILAYLEGL